MPKGLKKTKEETPAGVFFGPMLPTPPANTPRWQRSRRAILADHAADDEEEIVSTKEPEKAHAGVGGDHSQLQQEEEMMI